jgi:cytosine/adenosine deaminase-related metal-dependent hydrolase
MHLAESREELQWLDHRTGTLGEWIGPKTDANHRSHLGNIDDHLRLLADAWRALVVHGNYLQEHQFDFLSGHRERMAVVYCPRTHAWFRHSEHPMIELRSRDISVLLGTDSRASNPDLNLWGEVSMVASHRPDCDPLSVARMITLDASRFLDVPRNIGRIQEGGASQLTALRWDRVNAQDAGPQTEQELWRWMVQHGDPYPLEMDDRFALVSRVCP